MAGCAGRSMSHDRRFSGRRVPVSVAFAKGMEVQIETDQRRRCVMVLGKWQLVDIHRKNRDLVTMRLVARRRTRAAISVSARNRFGSG